MAGSSSEKPRPLGLQAVYTLKADGGPDWTALDISSSVAPRGPTLGAMMFSTNRRLAPPCASPAVICCVVSASGKGIGASDGPEFGTSVSMATSVSLAKNRSCRYVARSTQSSRGLSVQPGGSMLSTSPVVSGEFWTQGPPGMTWWVCTSKMNSPVPASACWQATVSSGGGVVKVPPREDGVGREVADVPHPAS